MSRIVPTLASLLITGLIFTASPSVSIAEQDPHAHHRHTGTAAADSVRIELADETLLNRQAQSLRFASDVVGDHLVAINIMYTTCTTVCPVTSALFARLQQLLGDRLGPEVRLVSVSVDPVTDTPERMAAYAEKMHASANWYWLTGDKPAVDAVLNGLGAYTADFTQHPAMVIVGDPESNQWSRFYGFPSPEKLLAELNRFSEHRASSHSNPSGSASESTD